MKPLKAVLLGLGLLACPLARGQTVTYQDGDTNSTDYMTSGTLVLSIASGAATQSGTIDGSGGVNKTGNGDLYLTGDNSYAGATLVQGGTLTVLGPGVIDQPNSALTVSSSNSNPSLIIQDGGQVSAGSSTIGSALSNTAQVTVEGADGIGNVSKLSLNGTLNVGGSGYDSASSTGLAGGGTLLIQDGGQVTNLGGPTVIGNFSFYSSGVTVSGINANGAASSLAVQSLIVGLGNTEGGAATLTVSNGGQVSSTSAQIAVSPGVLDPNTGFVSIYYGEGVVTISGVNANGTASSWTNSGDLAMGVASSPGTSTLTISNGGVVTTGRLVFTGKSTVNIDSNGVLALGSIVTNFGVTTSGTINFDGGILRATEDSTVFASPSFTHVQPLFNLGSGGGTIDNNGYNITFASNISGTGALTYTGAGITTASGTNTYSGGTNLTGGTLSLGSSGALGTTGSLSFNGGMLQYTSANTTDYSSRFSTGAEQLYNVDTNGQTVTWATALTSTGGSLTKNGAGGLILTGSNTYDGATTINAGTLQIGNGGASGFIASMAIADRGTLAFDRSDNISYSGNITGSGALSQTGMGLLTLLGTNTYTGGTTVSTGTLLAGSATALASGTSGAGYVINGGTLNLNNYNLTMSALSGTGGNVILGTAALTVDQSAPTIFAGAITGAGGFTKIGGGSLTLSGTSSFTGSLSPNEGTLNITGSVTNASTSGIATTGTAATVNVTGPGASWTDNADTLIGFNGGTGYLSISDGAYVSDTFSLVGRLAANDAGYVTVTGIDSMWYHSSGLVVGTGGIGVLNVDSGGTVEIGSGGTGSMTLGDFAGSSGVLNIGAAAGQVALAPGMIEAEGIIGGSGMAVVNFNHTSTGYTFAPLLSGNLSVQQNAGDTILTGSNTYTGGTAVLGGTLTADNNTALGTGAVNVLGGTLLIGNGYVLSNTITLSGGGLAQSVVAGTKLSSLPVYTSSANGGTKTTAKILGGQSSGTATITGSFSSLSAALNDGLRVSDVFNFSGVNVVNVATKQTDTFVLQLQLDPSMVNSSSFLAWLDPTTNTWINAVLGNIGGTMTFVNGAYNASDDDVLGYYGVDATDGSVWAVLDHNSSFSVVPEPSTWIMFGLSLVALATLRRRAS